MEYRNTNRCSNRSNSSSGSNSKNTNNYKNISKNASNSKVNSNKSSQYDFLRFFNSKCESVASSPKPSTSRNALPSTSSVVKYNKTAEIIKSSLTTATAISSKLSDVDDSSNSSRKLYEPIPSKTNTLSSSLVASSNNNRIISNASATNCYDNNIEISSTSSISSQCKFRKTSVNYNNSKGEFISNSQEILTSNGSPCNSNKSRKRKRRSTLNDKDLLYESESKRASIMNVTESSSSTFIPIASTSSSYLSSGILHSKTPNSYQSSEIRSLPSSVGSSSLNSPLSHCGGTEEIDEFIEHEIDARSSSSCLSVAGAEFDFVPSSDESTLVSESLTTTSNSENHKNRSHLLQEDSIQQINQHFITPHKTRALTPSLDIRPCPLPALSWANAPDVWNSMCRNDEKAASDRSSSMLDNHFGLQARMRAILLDWLIEVCEVYKLHRETYYLAVDYLDRYLSTQKNVQKTHLQLIGITCLFVAAKVEEIYPPKIGEFAYVTDGACQDEDILQHELLLLSALDWCITPVTIMGWLGVYMQLNVNNRSAMAFFKTNTSGSTKDPSSLPSKSLNDNSSNSCKKDQDRNLLCLKENNNVTYNNNNYFNNENCSTHNNKISKNCNDNTNNNNYSNSSAIFENDSGISISSEIDDAFIYPQFSGFEFSQTAQLIDLCTLDLGIADFSYSIIAAAAMSHTFGRETAVRVSGYEWESLKKCAKWMEPFFDVIKDEAQYFFLSEQNEQVSSRHGLGHICPKITTDDSHMIQTHTTSITMLEKALLRHEHLLNQAKFSQPEASPAIKISIPLCPEGLLTPPASSRKPMNDDEIVENEQDLQRKIT